MKKIKNDIKHSNPVAPKPETWVSQFGSFLYSYAIFRVREKQIAEDLVQETLLSALESYKNFKHNSSLKTWLTAILRNKIFDYYKESNRTLSISSIELEEEENSFIDNYFQNNQDNYPYHWKMNTAPSQWSQSPIEVIEQEEFQLIFQKCLNNVPQKHANIFVLREIDGLSSKEICKDLDITESNIWVILHRVRTSLRNCLEHNWFGEK
jgi:RNA polymerase sigma-70 factor (ECF subfamily)